LISAIISRSPEIANRAENGPGGPRAGPGRAGPQNDGPGRAGLSRSANGPGRARRTTGRAGPGPEDYGPGRAEKFRPVLSSNCQHSYFSVIIIKQRVLMDHKAIISNESFIQFLST
jgi:hypothetical protein